MKKFIIIFSLCLLFFACDKIEKFKTETDELYTQSTSDIIIKMNINAKNEETLSDTSPEQPADMQMDETYKQSIYAVNPTKEFLKTDPSKGEDYNAVIKAYNEFLRGNIDAGYKDDNDNNRTRNINTLIGDNRVVYGNDEPWKSVFNYALFDMNGNGIPELLIYDGVFTIGFTYYIYTYAEDNIVFLLEASGWSQHGGITVLENGAIFTTHVTTGGWYVYYTLDMNDNVSELKFESPGIPDYPYYFNEKEVSEEEWHILTEEYFKLAEKRASIEGQDYWAEPFSTITTEETKKTQ